MALLRAQGADLTATATKLIQVASEMMEVIGKTKGDRAALLAQFKSDESQAYDEFKETLDQAYTAMEAVVDAGGQWADQMGKSAGELVAQAAAAWRGA
jgi:hypothetical protein